MANRRLCERDVSVRIKMAFKERVVIETHIACSDNFSNIGDFYRLAKCCFTNIKMAPNMALNLKVCSSIVYKSFGKNSH